MISRIDFKFRAIDKETSVWVYGLPKIIKNLTGDTIAVFIQTYDRGHRLVDVEVIPDTVGEFSGVKDRNGIEIYENAKVLVGKDVYVICFLDGSFYAVKENSESKIASYFWEQVKLEVVEETAK